MVARCGRSGRVCVVAGVRGPFVSLFFSHPQPFAFFFLLFLLHNVARFHIESHRI